MMKLFILLFILFFGHPVIALVENPVLYYSPSCPHCIQLIDFLDTFEIDHNLHVNQINANEDPTGFYAIQQEYGIPLNQMGGVPKIFFSNGEYCAGDTPCIDYLEKQYTQETPIENNTVPSEEESSSPVNVWQLLGLALVDSVNPCELAVLIILMTAILSRFPGDKKKALRAGLSFTLAIFLAYFFFGLLILLGFKTVLGITSFGMQGLFFFLGMLAILLGLLNMKDAFWYGGGGFVMEVPMRWRPHMKRIIGEVVSTKGAFLAGLLVSFFLTPCTSGPYFVAGGILANLSWMESLPYLVGYLLIFVFPMLAITFIVYAGSARVEQLSEWKEKNTRGLHAIAGLLLLGLGIAMLLGWV
ncbi:MAG: GAP family protein [Candidatus Diapherotrites archaeon]